MSEALNRLWMSKFKERVEVIDEAYRIQGSHSPLQYIQYPKVHYDFSVTEFPLIIL
ncbi:hypothetical protein HYC85_010123 [Camellia sinensis]|uniref:Uncharacterized protein n=1 Tax=Camellia sinensis TaxID=4442 RepID=A0A7J7HHK1_CAMSI|nr:hypothetical protein HYC85_010123 [Camellia sinensis]